MKYFSEIDLNLLKDPKYLEEFLQQYHSSLRQYYVQHPREGWTPQDTEATFLRNKTELLNSLRKPTSQWSSSEIYSLNNIFHIHRKYHNGINLSLEQQVKETLYREYPSQRASELWNDFQTAYRKSPSQQTPQDLKLVKRILNINKKKGVGPSREFTEVKASFVPRKLSKEEIIKIEKGIEDRRKVDKVLASFVPPSLKPYTHTSIEDMAVNLRMPLAPSGWQNMPNFSPRLIFMDTETTGWIADGKKRSDIPLSVSTLYATMDRNTGKLYYVGSNERFYLPPNKNSQAYLSSIETHGLTVERLKELQKQGVQGNKYWNEQELQDIITEWTIQPSILVGHNVWDYDIQKALKAQHLLGSLQHIDTLDVAKGGIIGASSYTLTSLFKRATQGKGPEEYGINPHESGSDVIMNAFVFAKLFGSKNTLGVHHRTIEELNYILDNYDRASSAPFYRGSGVVVGTYGRYGSTDIGNYISVPKGYKRGGNIVISEDELAKAGMHIIEDNREQLMEDSSIMNESLKSILGLQGTLQELTSVLKEDRKNNGSTEFMYDFRESLNTFNSYKRLSLAQMYANKRLDDSEIEAILASQGMGYYSKDIITSSNILRKKGEWKEYSDEYLRMVRKGEQNSLYGKHLYDILQQDKWNELYSSKGFQDRLKEAGLYQRSKLTDKVNKLYNKGIIDDVQKEELLQIEANAELAQSIAEVTQKSKEATNAWKAFTNIKMYDPNRLYSATQSQIGGISSALSSIVPSFASSPLSHLTQSLSMQLAGTWEPYKNTLSGISAIGNGITAAGTGLLPANPLVGGIVMGVGQLFNLGSQIVGNVKETQINKEGYAIQQQIHGIGFLTDYVSLPFKLLASAAKTLIRSFGLLGGSVLGLVKGLSSLTEKALSTVGAQGNPLTLLTGQTYGGYMDSLGIDYASLLSSGSSSAMLEEFTNLRNMSMYGEGISQDKIIAGSLLGVIGSLYGSTNDPQGAFYGMVNDIFNLISNADPMSASSYMSLAKQLHSSLPSLLQTMDVFGVTDIRDLMDPSSRGIYWSPMLDTKASRGAYYEYQMSQVQRQESQKKAGTYLWEWIGKDTYNGVNKIFDAIATGDWEVAADNVVSLWDKIKGKLQELWTSFKGKFDIDADLSLEGFFKSNLWEPIKLGAVELSIKVLEWLQNTGIPAFMKVWGSLLDYMTEGIVNLVGFLSTIDVDVDQLINNITKGTDDPWISIGPKTGFSDINPNALIKSEGAEIYEQFLWKSGLGSLDASNPAKKASDSILFSATSIGKMLTSGSGMGLSSLEYQARRALGAGSTLRIEDSNASLFGLSKGFTIQTEKELEDLLNWITIFNSGSDKDKSSGYFFYKNTLPISSEFDKYTLPVREALETANVVSTQIVQNGILGDALSALKDAKITIEQRINGKEVASVTITPDGNTTSNIRDVTYVDGALGVSTAVRKNY